MERRPEVVAAVHLHAGCIREHAEHPPGARVAQDGAQVQLTSDALEQIAVIESAGGLQDRPECTRHPHVVGRALDVDDSGGDLEFVVDEFADGRDVEFVIGDGVRAGEIPVSMIGHADDRRRVRGRFIARLNSAVTHDIRRLRRDCAGESHVAVGAGQREGDRRGTFVVGDPIDMPDKTVPAHAAAVEGVGAVVDVERVLDPVE